MENHHAINLGKSTVSMVIFNSFLLVHQRVIQITLRYINIDPENHQFLMETSLNQPLSARVYVNLPEGTLW